MKSFTGAEYLLIDLANNYGLDKETFDKRIAWARANFNDLEGLVQEADEPLLFLKSLQTIREVEAGLEIGHLVEMDATTSGIQIMSAMTGCPTGAKWTNLVDTSKRYDAYTESFESMKTYLSKTVKEITRGMAKDALMTGFYGSSAVPEKVFGKGTNELDAFYSMAEKRLKGAWELRCDLIDVWNPYAESHSWSLPDGFECYVRTTVKRKIECEIDELDHHKFTHIYESFEGTERGVSLAANVIHSIDGYMVREISRRCNYKVSELDRTMKYIDKALEHRDIAHVELDLSMPMSVVWATKFGAAKQFAAMDTSSLLRLRTLLIDMRSRPSFPVICIHDAYKSHPNYVDHMRYWYKEVLAELAESDLLSHIFSELSGEDETYENVRGGYTKTEMAELIRKSEYSIC